MSLLQSILLGAIQGLTEFFPVSSSAHLVFAKSILGISTSGAGLEAALHLGTLLSVLIFFRKDILKMLAYVFFRVFSPARLAGAGRAEDGDKVVGIIIGTLPAVVIGFAFKSQIERSFSNPGFAAVALIITGIFLLLTRRRSEEGRPARRSDWLKMGVAQAVSILPGISRSGSTIGTGILAGLKRDTALRMSFLLSIPAIGGAAILEFSSILKVEAGAPLHLFAGVLSAFLFGCLAIWTLFRFVRRGAFEYFGVYCVLAGLAASIYFLW